MVEPTNQNITELIQPASDSTEDDQKANERHLESLHLDRHLIHVESTELHSEFDHDHSNCTGHDHDHDHHHNQPQHGYYQMPRSYQPPPQQHHHHHHGGQCCSHDHGAYEEFQESSIPYHHMVPQIPNKFLDKSQFNVENEFEKDGLKYMQFKDETQMPLIMNLITKDLSEPYSIYTYRYFIHNWPNLCFLAMDKEECIGAIVCKLDRYKDTMRGYIAMLDVDDRYRRKGIGSVLVSLAIRRMIQNNADEVVLEAEVTNKGALRLYENLGFVRDKRLFRYYLNGVEAFRLKLWLK